MSKYLEKNPETCRTCLSISNDMMSILDTKPTNSVAFKDIIMSIANVQISEKDGLTIFVCRKCTLDAEGAYDFKLRCEASDTLLRTKAENMMLPIPIEFDTKKEMEDIVKEELVNVKNEPNTSYEIRNVIDDDDDEVDTDYNLLGPVDPIKDAEPENSKPNQIDANEITTSKNSNNPQTKKLRSAKKNHISSQASVINITAGKDAVGLKLTRRPRNSNKIAYSCQFCKAIFRSVLIYHKHQNKVHGVPLDQIEDTPHDSHAVGSDYKCMDCDFTSVKFSLLKKHILIHTGEKPIFCDECTYRCVGVGSLVRHKLKHSGDKPFPCKECPYRGGTARTLRLHMSKHNEQKPFSCELCPYTCKRSSGIRHHMTWRHGGRRNHACHLCEKRFFIESHLKVHLRVHTGERPYVCEMCGAGFIQRSNLTKHVEIAHTPKDETQDIACPQCDYRTTSLRTLYSHTRHKHAPKKAVCDVCDYKSASFGKLKAHKRIHVGDTRFSCDICSYACYTMNRLKSHKRVHTGEKPYPCTKCDYRGATNSALCKHMKSHLNERAYACAHCPYTANYKYNLTQHLKGQCGRNAKLMP